MKHYLVGVPSMPKLVAVISVRCQKAPKTTWYEVEGDVHSELLETVSDAAAASWRTQNAAEIPCPDWLQAAHIHWRPHRPRGTT